MYRLLIVDNEEIIVNHLHEIFRGLDHLDLDVYKAYGGEEAIEWLHRTRIDIVLTDIDMPDINGLQLMEEIFRSWPQCKVIFLTGHSEFDYVYKAIQRQDVSYILKTEDIDKVVQVVEENIYKIRKEIKTEDLIRNAKEQIHMALDLFQEDYLQCVIKGNVNVQVSREQFEQLSLSLQPQLPVALIMGKIDKFPEGSDYMQQMQLIYSVRPIIRRYLATHVNMFIVLDENHRFIVLVQPKEKLSIDALQRMNDSNRQTAMMDSYAKTVSFLKGVLEAIQSACQDSIGLPISFTVAGQACSWEELPSQYHTLNHLLNYRIGVESSILLVDNEINHNLRMDIDPLADYEEESEEAEQLAAALKSRNLTVLEQYLETGQRSKYFEALEQILTPLKSIHSKNNVLALEVYHTVSLYLMSYMNRWELANKMESQVGRLQWMRADLFDTWADAAQHLLDLSTVFLDMHQMEQKKRADNIIDHLQQFITEHLDEDLSLVRLAEQVYLNPSYLSRIYKQETGRNLTEFIETTRLAKAKQLLKMENMRIHDVARRVGYETATSFTRFFKKATGYSPQEYKEKHTLRLP